MRQLLRGDRGTVLARLRHLWFQGETEGVELLSATLSLSFAATLFATGNNANALDHAYLFAALCLLSSSMKIVGVLGEYTGLRLAGLIVGTLFWVTLSGVFLTTVRGSITWLCFAVMALAQLWAIGRLLGARWK